MYAGGSRTALQKLEVMQNNFLRLALGALRTSPIPSLQVEANIAPLHIRRIDLTMRYYTKIKQFPEHAAFAAIATLPRLHFSYLGPAEKRTGLTIASRVKKYEGELDYSLPAIPPLPRLDVAPWLLRPLAVSFLLTVSKRSLSSEEVQQTFLKYKTEHPTFRFIYTDGSKDQDLTGIGVFSQDLIRVKKRLSNNTSIYSAELHAILTALNLIKQHRIQRACICSDSKSAIQSLRSLNVTQHTHISIVQLHQHLSEEGIEIQFLWVPGHQGIIGNEMADRYAKQALQLAHVSQTHFDVNAVHTSVKSRCHRLWQLTWDSNGPGSHLYQIKPRLGYWVSSSRTSRKEEKALARLRIGHTYLTHSFIYTNNPRPTCSRCRTVLSLKHIILHCEKYNNERNALQQYCRTHAMQLTLPSLLGDDHEDLLQLLFSFLVTTNLINRL
ncbi:uncharacterized protein LOC122394400 [Amphibalanus amphitrite]|uniref:uncharacterized protein LOC122394400 n=1 Tax=Amphibalanus amphitrite TaxID=1232801 RepID=UPI001C90522A|nr:uncharacterized protein LOC122394400 [Amphibalanus amphitrite]